jgi:hypothetical protein
MLARPESPVNELAYSKVISEQKRAELLSANWKALLDQARTEDLERVISEIDDAKSELQVLTLNAVTNRVGMP